MRKIFLFCNLALLTFVVTSNILANSSNAPPFQENQEGFIYIQEGHLYQNGQRVRFYGLNLLSEIFRWEEQDEVKEIDAILDRVKRLGTYNLIRPHLYARFLFRDQSNTHSLPNHNESGYQDSYLQKFDYFLAGLKQHDLKAYLSFNRWKVPVTKQDYQILQTSNFEDDLGRNISQQEWTDTINAPLDQGIISGMEYWFFVDERAREIKYKYAENLLTHYNPYSQTTYADDPTIALYEISNENLFIRFALNDGPLKLDDMPTLYRDQLRYKWNKWLTEKYSQSELQNRWGEEANWDDLTSDEILSGYSVKIKINRQDWQSPRMQDYVQFLVDTYADEYQKFYDHLRSLGVKVPIAFSTNCGACAITPIHYANSQGDLIISGAYYTMAANSADEELYPWKSFLRENTPSKPWMPTNPWLNNLDYVRVKDKPFMIYETNIHKPAHYRAEFPMLLTTLGSWQDWDGISFFPYVDDLFQDLYTDEQYLKWGIRYGNLGAVHANDEIFHSQKRLASEVFRNFYIPPANSPTQLNVGKDLILRGDGYKGFGGSFMYELLGTAWKHGVRLNFAPSQNQSNFSGTTVSNRDLPLQFNQGDGVQIDTQQGTLSIDTPRAKSIVGFYGNNHQFSGVRLNNISISNLDFWEQDFPLAEKFSAFSLTVLDGRPITDSRNMLISFVSSSEKNGMQMNNPIAFNNDRSKGYQAGGRPNYGNPVMIYKRINGDVYIQNKQENLRCKKIDFTFKTLSDEPCQRVEDEIKIHYDSTIPVYLTEIYQCDSLDQNCDGSTNLLDLLHWRREVATRETKERDLLDYLQVLRGWFST